MGPIRGPRRRRYLLLPPGGRRRGHFRLPRASSRWSVRSRGVSGESGGGPPATATAAGGRRRGAVSECLLPYYVHMRSLFMSKVHSGVGGGEVTPGDSEVTRGGGGEVTGTPPQGRRQRRRRRRRRRGVARGVGGGSEVPPSLPAAAAVTTKSACTTLPDAPARRCEAVRGRTHTKAAGGEARLCARPLHAAKVHNPPRRICKKGRVRDN